MPRTTIESSHWIGCRVVLQMRYPIPSWLPFKNGQPTCFHVDSPHIHTPSIMASEADEEKKSPVVIGSGSALSPQGAAASSSGRPDGAGQTQVPVVPVKTGASWSVSFNLFATAVTYLCAFLVTFAVTALVGY